MEGSQTIDGATLLRERRALHPHFRHAVTEDVKVTCAWRGERHDIEPGWDTFAQAVRLAWVSDAFFWQALYRLRARLYALGVPILPRLLHRVLMAGAQMSIGDPVIIHPGVYIVHGQVVLDGLTEIGSGCVIAPFVSIGLRSGDLQGPTLEHGVVVGTGTRILGRLTIGAHARIGANAVVVKDISEGETVVGIPAEPLKDSQEP